MTVVSRALLDYNLSMTWDIYGNESAVAMLREHTQPEKLRHAYLLTGPKGVGRRTLALAFIKALNCPTPIGSGIPCGVCTTCQQIDRQEFPDLAVITAEEGHKDIRIDQIRSLERSLVLAPYQARYRTALILDFEKATAGASNALLKTLEEPPPKAVLILTADAQENLLSTISSRCEVLRLRPMPVIEAEKVLISEKRLNPMDARLLAHVTSGRLGAALQLYHDPQAMANRKRLLDELADILQANRRERLAYVDHIFKHSHGIREEVSEIISIWLSFWRDVLIVTSAADSPLANLDLEKIIHIVAKKTDLNTAQFVMTSLEDGLKQLDIYTNPRLLVENLLLLWPRIRLKNSFN